MLLTEPVVWGLLVLLTLWLIGITFWLYTTVSHYKKLTGGDSSQNLQSVLEKVLINQDRLAEHIKIVEGSLNILGKASQLHIQKVGTVRFNPYNDTGGDQSFSLALLDKQDTGVVLLSLHGREVTRIYVKPVNAGKSKYELSKEEKQAIEMARSLNSKS